VSKRSPKNPSALNYEQLHRAVAEGSIEPLYLFVGDEDYYHQQAIGLLFGTVDEAAREFNTAVITIGSDFVGPSGIARKVTAADAIDTANLLPMMAARRIVVIKGFDKIKEDELELVLDYLKSTSAFSAVVFDAPS